MLKYIGILFISIGLSATITVPDDYTTIQEAVDASQDGDMVLVRSNVYFENVVVDNKNIKLVSEYYTGVLDEINQTIIIGDSDSGPAVTFKNNINSTAEFSGFYISQTLIYGGC